MTIQSADFGKIAITWGGAWTAHPFERLTCVSHENATWISTRDMLASEEPGISPAWSKATEGSSSTFGVCSTPAATAEKTMNTTGFTLSTGASLTVTFTYANTAASPTLNVNGTGAISVDLAGVVADRPYRFQYNGTSWIRESPLATTEAPGIVCLDTSLSSEATDRAATPSAVKAAYARGSEGVTLAQSAMDEALNKVGNLSSGTNSIGIYQDSSIGKPVLTVDGVGDFVLGSGCHEVEFFRHGHNIPCTLPSGGTWLWFAFGHRIDSVSAEQHSQWSWNHTTCGIAPGGTLVYTTGSSDVATLICIRLNW